MELDPAAGDLVSVPADVVRVPADYDPPKNERRAELTALAFFVCFDLAGSTAYKMREENWADVITYFYGQIVNQIIDVAPEFEVWKYLGDEVAFYAYVTDLDQLEKWVRLAFSSQRAVLVSIKSQHPEVEQHLSIKATCWIAPVCGYETIPGISAPEIIGELPVIGRLKIRDRFFRDRKNNVDFIGPNIDAGFRLAAFSRPLQLTVSPALGYVFLTGAKKTNDLRVVGFEALKGVAGGMLYPAVWYHENWHKVAEDFGYVDRFTDPIVQRVCLGHHDPLDVLDEVRQMFKADHYFFNVDDLRQLASASAPFVAALRQRKET